MNAIGTLRFFLSAIPDFARGRGSSAGSPTPATAGPICSSPSSAPDRPRALAASFGGLVILKRIDRTWVLIRRAAGYDQRKGVLTPVFATTCVVGVVCFTVWLLGFAGLGPTLAPTG